MTAESEKALSQLEAAIGLLHSMVMISIAGFFLHPGGIVRLWWAVGTAIFGAVRERTFPRR